MKKVVLVVLGLMFCVSAYADKTISVTLTDTQYDALTVLPNETPDEWVQTAATNKAEKLIEALVKDYSDKQPGKISDNDKKDIINGIDLEKEKEKRKGK